MYSSVEKSIDNDFILYKNLPQWSLTSRQLCDIELILNGAFYPLSSFMSKNDYYSVCKKMRLSNNQLWPIPITLDISDDFLEKNNNPKKIILKDKEGFSIAILDIDEVWVPNLEDESEAIYGTNDKSHAGVRHLLKNTNKNYVSGKIKALKPPHHYDFKEIRQTPKELKDFFIKNSWDKIIAFQTRNPMHRAHFEMTRNAMKTLKANLLIHPVVGLTKPGDIDYFTRVRCYYHILKKYPKGDVKLSLINLAMRMAGPKEALWHSIIRKNYGCTHIIIGRDHAGPGLGKNGKIFYDPFEAQNLLKQFQSEIGIEMISFKKMVFLSKTNAYEPLNKENKNKKHKTLSGTELRKLIDEGKDIPDWFTFEEVALELQKSNLPLNKRGFTIFFTGLSGSGKSTLANALMMKLLEIGGRPVSLLDGDLVRKHLSSELGFSKKDRSINIKRIGYVASEITKNGGIAICAPIAPYEDDRIYNRTLISKYGGYLEVFVSTPLEICEKRDPKGLYKLANKGIIKEFTGVSDPYEKPKNPDLILDSSIIEPNILINKIIKKLYLIGFLRENI